LGKAAVVLGMVISLVGGIAPRLIKADGNVDVIVRGEAGVTMAFGNPKAAVKTAVESQTVAKKNTKARVKKGNNTMTTINSISNGVGNASSLPGE